MDVPNFLHSAAIRFNRHLARPLLGNTIGEESYVALRERFCPTNVTAADLTIDAGMPWSRDKASEARAVLDRHGVVVLRHFLGPALVTAARREVDALTEELSNAIESPKDHGMMRGILWQVGGAVLPDHPAILAQSRPVANLRSKQRGTMNGGIIDLFYVDRAARENNWGALTACIQQMTAEPVMRLIAGVSSARPAYINLLRNDSVTATRGLHVDNLTGSYKLFLYLSDVTSIEDGPYAYVPDSHHEGALLRREARLNSLCGRSDSDAHSFEGREIPLLVEKGTAIVSCQSGVHRGLPQHEGHSRTVLVAKFD